MRIQDAKPGDILQDRDGAVWVNAQREIWACIFDPAAPRFDSDGDGLKGGRWYSIRTFDPSPPPPSAAAAPPKGNWPCCCC